MNREILEGMPALAPLEFFAVEGEFAYDRLTKLPDLSEWLAEESFAQVYVAWNETGISLKIHVNKPFEEAFYPRFSQGDAVELFFDTRDLKLSGFATRFCHQFVFLPQPVQGIQAQEITHFRTEDTHPLCDALELQISSKMDKKDYTLTVFIPAHCLHGFDPLFFEKIGFTYRIHRFKGEKQHFALSSQHFSLEQHPRLWASFKFAK